MQDTESVPSGQNYSYTRNPTQITKYLKTVLWVLVGVTVLSLISDAMQLHLLNSVPLTQAQAAANDARQREVAWLHLGIYLLTVILFARWIYCVSANCHGFGAQGMKFSPGWSVGCYFVPFTNLYRPFEAMREIWKVSEDPVHWKTAADEHLLRWWWGTWLLSGALGQLSFRLSSDARGISALRDSTTASILSGVSEIALCVVAMSLVSAIFERQEKLVGNVLPWN